MNIWKFKTRGTIGWDCTFWEKEDKSIASSGVNMRIGTISKTQVSVYYTYLTIMYII